MKIKYTLLTLVCLCTISLTAQTPIDLIINHQLSGNNFAFNKADSNNMNQIFKTTRLEYYISSITITHDTGKVTNLSELVFLAQPGIDNGKYALTNTANISNIEAIQFYIGVDATRNHEDPSQYFANHPLAPKSPSMHWGWNPGYRFLAIEGKSSVNLNQIFELHGLGDANYYSIKIPVTSTDVNGTKTITLNADYSRILENIVISSGVSNHGEDGDARTALQNMRDFVFTSTTGAGNTLVNIRQLEQKVLGIFPNPIAINQAVSISNLDKNANAVAIFDLNGKLISETKLNDNNVTISNAGIYMLLIKDENGNVLQTSKITVL